MKKVSAGHAALRELHRIDSKRAEELQLDFEIGLYEAHLHFRPESTEALFGLGNAYTKRGLYGKGLEIDLRLVRLEPDNPTFNYNLACSYSLLKEVDHSIETLKRAIDLGFDDRKQMQNDPDLENVRQDPRFEKLLSSRRAR